MKAFHAASREMIIGQRYGGKGRYAESLERYIRKYSGQSVASIFERMKAIEIKLDSYANTPIKRQESWYACHILDDVHLFCTLTNKDRPKFIYEVEIDPLHRAPMAIPQYLRATQNASNESKLIEEYWKPTQPWSFIELLGQSLSVTSLIGIYPDYFRSQTQQSALLITRNKFEADLLLAKRL